MANRWPYQPSGGSFVLAVKPCSLSSPSKGQCSRLALRWCNCVTWLLGAELGEALLGLSAPSNVLSSSPCSWYLPKLCYRWPWAHPCLSQTWIWTNNLTSQPCTSLSQQIPVSSWTPGCPWSPPPSHSALSAWGPLWGHCPSYFASPSLLAPCPHLQPQPHYFLANKLEGQSSPFPVWFSYLYYISVINFNPMITKPEERLWKEMWRGKKGPPVYSGASRGGSAAAYTTHNPVCDLDLVV